MPKYYCCVPYCNTTGPPSEFFTFPMDPTERLFWIIQIPKTDWIIDHKSVLCPKHFQKGEVQRTSGKLTLVNKPVPTIFPLPPRKPHEKYLKMPREMFEVPSRDEGPETFGDLEQLNPNETDDFIVDFYYLKLRYFNQLKHVLAGDWKVIVKEHFVVFALIGLDLTKVSVIVKVDEQLHVEVTLGRRVVDALDLTRFVPLTGRLNRWSQLVHLLQEFGVEKGNSLVSCEVTDTRNLMSKNLNNGTL